MAKNFPFLSLVNHKQMDDQAFYKASSKIIPDSQLQKEVAKLEHQVLEAKKVVL